MVATLCRDCQGLRAGRFDRCPACGSPRLVAHAEIASLAIAHLDCDAFYASVEKRDHPELRDRPVIVGGGRRGVVSTACYIARLSGVRSAMPMFKALRLCPEAVVLRPDFSRYREESRRIMALARALTPLVQPLSLDEAWLDLSGTERLHGAPPAVSLARLQAAVERDTGLSVSVGLAPNRFLAKIASEIDKPRGFAVIGAAEARAFLAPQPVTILPGVGPAQAARLATAGLRTVGDIASVDPADLTRRLGEPGERLRRLALGLDDRAVDPDQTRKSVSAETTFHSDLTAVADLEAHLWSLAERVARRAREGGLGGRVVTLKLRKTDFAIVTRRQTLDRPTQTARTLFAVAARLLQAEATGQAWRLIGVGLSGLSPEAAEESLFAQEEDRVLEAERAIDRLRLRFGEGVVVRARNLKASGAV